jgi:hypothetical protein
MARKAMRPPILGARLHKTDPAVKRESPNWKTRRRPSQHEQAGDYKGIGVEDPLQSRQCGVKFVLNGRQRNVDDGHVHAYQQQTHAADAEDQIRPVRPFASRGLCGDVHPWQNLLGLRGRLQSLRCNSGNSDSNCATANPSICPRWVNFPSRVG